MYVYMNNICVLQFLLKIHENCKTFYFFADDNHIFSTPCKNNSNLPGLCNFNIHYFIIYAAIFMMT